MRSSLVLRRGRVLAALSGMLAVLALAGARQAKPELTPPILTLAPSTVANGAATVAGTVGGTPDASVQVTVDGQPVTVDAAGNFVGVVNLSGASSLDIALGSPGSGENVAFHIPLTTGLVGPGGVIPSNVLDGLRRAGVSLLKPLGGFAILDGRPLTVGGRVLQKDELAGLTVNGVDVLGQLRPDQSFSAEIPGTSKEVQLTATDKQGVSETSSYGVLHSSTLIETRMGTSVAASGALGLRIASVRYYTKGVARTRRLRMVVTVKDRRGYLVRGAVVSVRSAKAGRVANRLKAKRSTLVGQAAFTLRLAPRALGKRLVMVATARTPTAKAMKITSAAVPRKAQARQAKRPAHR